MSAADHSSEWSDATTLERVCRACLQTAVPLWWASSCPTPEPGLSAYRQGGLCSTREKAPGFVQSIRVYRHALEAGRYAAELAGAQGRPFDTRRSACMHGSIQEPSGHHNDVRCT